MQDILIISFITNEKFSFIRLKKQQLFARHLLKDSKESQSMKYTHLRSYGSALMAKRAMKHNPNSKFIESVKYLNLKAELSTCSNRS